MDKYIYDENNGIWYELQDDYYLPCLTLPLKKKRLPGYGGGSECLCAANWASRQARNQNKRYFFADTKMNGMAPIVHI